jgi:hypothetical protein
MTPQEQLEHERHVAEILAIRSRKDSPSQLSTWLNSPVLATLIGVIGTGILGALVSGLIQERSTTNEMDRSAHERKVSAQNAVVEKVIKLIGGSMSTMDDLLVSVNHAYSERGRSQEEIEKLREWRAQLAGSRDAADLAWRQEKGSLGYTILYLFDGNDIVNGAWQAVTDAAENFERCTRGWYTHNAATGTELAASQICSTERRQLDASVETFAKSTSEHSANRARIE